MASQRWWEDTGDPKQIKRESKKPAEWNEYVITCRGNQPGGKLNGNVTVDITDNDTRSG